MGYHRDLQSEFAIAAMVGVQIRYPYLDDNLVARALMLPGKAPLPRSSLACLCKEQNSEVGDTQTPLSVSVDGAKSALRAVAVRAGAPPSLFTRRKRAAQYGSRFHQALKMLAARRA